MKYSLKAEGLEKIIDDLRTLGKEGTIPMNQALIDTGKKIIKFLKAERNAGGFVPLGRVSNLKGHKKPWGKIKFVSINYKKRSGQVIVTSKGLNKKLEEGGFVKISDRFKKFLHWKGIHIKKSTTMVRIPARPLFKRTWERHKEEIVSIFKERLIYRLNRRLRTIQFKNSKK